MRNKCKHERSSPFFHSWKCDDCGHVHNGCDITTSDKTELLMADDTPEVVYTANKPLNFVEKELGIHRMVSDKPIDDDDIAWKRADLVVDRSLAEEILGAVTETGAYTYFRYKLNSARGE